MDNRDMETELQVSPRGTLTPLGYLEPIPCAAAAYPIELALLLVV